jgi:hypothetical protein
MGLHSTHYQQRNTWKIWSGNLNRTDHLEDSGIDEKIIFKCFLKKQVVRNHLTQKRMKSWAAVKKETFKFHKMWRNSWLVKQGGVCSMEIIH